MLTEKMKVSLCEKLNTYVTRGNDDLNENTLKKMIEVFDHSLDIEPVQDVAMAPINIVNAIERYLEGGMEKAPECVEVFNKIEQYSKHILFATKPKLLNTTPERKWDQAHKNNSKDWELKDVYVEGLKILDEKIQLKKEGDALVDSLVKNPTIPISSLKDFYLVAYSTRNLEDHWAIKREAYLANKVILCVIMAYMLIADKYSTVIEKLYGYARVKNCLDIDDFLKKVLSEKQNKLNRYVPLAWIEYSKNNNNKMLLPDKVEELSQKHIRIVGDAGTGKTVFLEKIECLLAQRCIDSEKKYNLIPIYLRLIELSRQGLSSIKALFINKTGISEDEADALMVNKSILLLLDGYDEISTADKALKREIAIEVETLVSRDANIIITDRSLNSMPPLSKDLLCYTPQKMVQSNYKELISKYSQNEDIKNELLRKVDSSPEFFDRGFNTPLKIVNLVEICDFNGTIIEDQSNIKNAYIQFLFDREAQQKKNPLTKPLQRLLAGLALEDEESFSEAMILSVFSKWKTKLGYECDTDACLSLAIQLGIIVEEADDSHIEYHFNEDFYVAFLDLADRFGLIDLEE